MKMKKIVMEKTKIKIGLKTTEKLQKYRINERGNVFEKVY